MGSEIPWIDIVLVTIMLAYLVAGLFQGVILQLFRLAGLILAIVYAYFVAEAVGQWLASSMSLNPLLAYYIALVIGALVVYALCCIAGRGVHRLVSVGGEVPAKANRILGAALGLLKGALIAYLLAALIDMIPAEAMAQAPWVPVKLSGAVQSEIKKSHLLAQVHPFNVLPSLRFLADVDEYKMLLETIHDDDKQKEALYKEIQAEAQEILQGQPAFNELVSHPRFRPLLTDPEIEKLRSEGKWEQLLVNKKVLPLMFDPEIRDILNRLNPNAALEQAKLNVAKRRYGKKE